MFSWVNKVTTGTQSFVLVLLNFGTWFDGVPAARIIFLEYVAWRVTLN